MLFSTQSKNELFTQELCQTIVALNDTAIPNALYKLFEAGGRGGSILYSMTVVTDDVQTRFLRLYEQVAGKNYLKDTINLPAATAFGVDGDNHEFNFLPLLAGSRIDGAGNRSLYVAPGKSLWVTTSLAPAADREIIIRAYGEHY